MDNWSDFLGLLFGTPRRALYTLTVMVILGGLVLLNPGILNHVLDLIVHEILEPLSQLAIYAFLVWLGFWLITRAFRRRGGGGRRDH